MQISHSGRGAYEASLAAFGDRFAATWYDTRDGRADIYLAMLDANGRPRWPEKRLTAGKAFAYEPDIQAVDSQLAIAWYEKAADGTMTAKLGLWTRDGKPRWTKSLSPAGRYGRNPVVRAARGKIFVAWLEYSVGEAPAVWGRWFDVQGTATASARRVAPAGPTTWNLNAAIDQHGRAWVVFDAQAGTRSDELFLVCIDGARTETVRLSVDDGFDSKYPDLAFSGDRAALTWFDARDGNEEVYLFVARADDLRAGFKDGLEHRAVRVTHTPGESIGVYLAWNGRQLGLAWCDNSEGKQHELFFQLFNDAAEAIGPAKQLTHNASWSLIPAIRPSREGFALVWNEFTPGALGAHGSDGRSEVMFATIPTVRTDASIR